MNKDKVVRLCGGLVLAVGVSLVPVGAIASSHATAAAGAAGYAGHNDRMAGAAVAGHQGAKAALDAAPSANQAPMPARHAPAPQPKPYVHKMAPMHDDGSVEGGSGSSDNDGGSIAGEDAPAHAHGDNQGGDIH